MIVIFSHVHPAISKGGAEVAAYTLYTGLLRLGIPAAFVAMCPAERVKQVALASENEYLVPYWPDRYDHLFHTAPLTVGQDVLALLNLLRPSALVFHHFLNLGINTIERILSQWPIPSALTLHEFLAICHHHGQMVTNPSKSLCQTASPMRCAGCFSELDVDDFQVRTQLFRSILSKLDSLISPSAFLAQRFAKWGAPAEKIHVVENGLMHTSSRITDNLATTKNRWWHRIKNSPPPSKPIFGYFGQINPFKGVNVLLDAAEILESTKANLTIRLHGNLIGLDESFRKRFDAAIARASVLEYAGPYQNTDVLRLMQQTNHVVMASTWWENSPVVIQEAYAAGRPLIVPALGGMAEKVIDGINGRHFSPGNPQDLARVLLDCIKNPKNYNLPKPLTAQEMAIRYMTAMNINPKESFPHL